MNEMKRLLSFVRRAADDYNMISDGDKIAVGVSGGKDSLTLLEVLAEMRRFYPQKYEICAITVDMGFQGSNFSEIEEFCRRINVEYKVVKTEIAKIIFDVRKESNPCSLCSKMRRGSLHAAAQELGCNKIALGHHMSDVIETTLLGLFYGAQMQSMPPKLHSKNFPGMELIRPLYCVHEDAIIAWKNYNDRRFLQCACRFTETCNTCDEEGVSESKRLEIKQLIARLKQSGVEVSYVAPELSN